MRPISQKNKDIINTDPYYKRCLRYKEGTCSGRITIEHTLCYSGRQIDEIWNLLPLCWYHHLGDGLDKLWNEWVSINRMVKKDEEKYPRKNWKQLRSYLNGKYEN